MAKSCDEIPSQLTKNMVVVVLLGSDKRKILGEQFIEKPIVAEAAQMTCD